MRAVTELGAEILRTADQLAGFSADGDAAMTRLYLTPEHKQATDYLAGLMRKAGLAVHLDATGTVVGRLEGTDNAAPALLLGSHIDTVRNGGKYDGNLGVLAAIAVLERLNREGQRLPYPVEILAFGDEEGVRFPVTLTSSRAVAGLFDPASLDAVDAQGISLRQALQNFGLDPAAIPAIARNPVQVAGYVELHIEQGPLLEAEGVPVGIVTAISGATRLLVRLTGFAGHAGTVPMVLRRDAGVAAAEMVLAVEEIALARPDIVVTVGKFSLSPGAVNVIPSGAEFTIDLRSPSDASRGEALAAIQARFADIAARREIGLSLKTFYEEHASTCDAALMDSLAAAVTAQGIAPRRLPSGAGHDGLAMSKLCPFAMLFVRCKGGISHNPAESVTAEDVGIAAQVLARFLQDYRPGL